MNAETENKGLAPVDDEWTPDDRKPDRLVVGHVQASPSIAKIAKALATAQAAFGPVHKESKADVKNKDNEFLYSYTYATLADSIAAISKAMTDNEIAVIQPTTRQQGMVTVNTMLVHSSGEWMSSELSMPVAENKAQAVGSAISYARRYSLQAFVGIAPDDDDGAEAQANPPKNDTPPRATQRKVTKGNDKPKPEPQHKSGPSNGDVSDKDQRGRDALAEYREATGDNDTPGRALLAEALGKPWPSKPTELEFEAAMMGLTAMANAKTGNEGPADYEPADYEPADGKGDELPEDGHEHGD